jgi:hypothetical protein
MNLQHTVIVCDEFITYGLYALLIDRASCSSCFPSLLSSVKYVIILMPMDYKPIYVIMVTYDPRLLLVLFNISIIVK